MLRPVWPSLDFWSIMLIISTFPWFLSSTQLGFVKRSTGLVAAFVWPALIFFSSLGTFVLLMLHISLRADPTETGRLFRGYERAGKIIGSALLLFGNVGLHYYSEKSVACMLTFLFLAFYCLCAVFCIQPCTGFGVMEFLLGSSLSQALSLFRLGFYTWLVLTVCIVVVGVRYCLEPDQSHRIAASSSGANEQNLVAMEEGRNLLHHEQRQGDVDDDREQELNLHMSGSAPTSNVEASLNEDGNLSEEMLRTDHPLQQELQQWQPLQTRQRRQQWRQQAQQTERLRTDHPLQEEQLLLQPLQQELQWQPPQLLQPLQEQQQEMLRTDHPLQQELQRLQQELQWQPPQLQQQEQQQEMLRTDHPLQQELQELQQRLQQELQERLQERLQQLRQPQQRLQQLRQRRQQQKEQQWLQQWQ